MTGALLIKSTIFILIEFLDFGTNYDEAELGFTAHHLVLRSSARANPSRRQCQVGSLAAAAHL